MWCRDGTVTAARNRQTGSDRVERKRGERVQQIVRTAAELFGERGYAAVSLEDVAERLDLTKGSLYYYFASKDELVTAAIETLGDAWTSGLEALAESHGGSAPQRLRALLREHITVAVRDYPAALRLFLEPRAWPSAQGERIKQLRRRHDGVFRAVIEDGLAAGSFTVVSVDTALQCMHAAMTQAPLWLGHREARAANGPIDELADTLMMLVGVRPDGQDRASAGADGTGPAGR